MNPRHRSARAGLCLLLLAASAARAQVTPSVPPEPRWMQVEVVAFRHVGADEGGEKWPTSPALSYPARLRFLLEPGSPAHMAALEARDFERALQAEAGSTAPPAPGTPQPVQESDELPGVLLSGPDTVLADAAARIAASPGYAVLAHLAWREPRLAEGSAEQVLVTGGATVGDHRELEGSIAVAQSRFLHIDTRLWLNDFPSPGEQPGSDAVTLPPIPQPVLPQPPAPDAGAATPATPEGAAGAPTDQASPAPGEPAVAAEPVRARRTVLLTASRRIANGEVHYIDHPLLGLLVTVRPWDPAMKGVPVDAPATLPAQGTPGAAGLAPPAGAPAAAPASTQPRT